MKNLAALLFVSFCCALAGCGGRTSTTACKITGINVGPQNAVADHAAASPGNQQQFLAFQTSAPPGCAFQLSNLTTATWSVSDPVAVSISSVQGPDYGKATCMTTTATPVTVTATVPAGDGTNVIGTTTMSCK